jgi:hypothetical protein
LNVLHINTDQQRFDALSCAGNSALETPNLDRLAREGVRFTHAFTPQPMCVAARCSLHTGLSIFTTHCLVTFENPEKWNFGAGTWDQCLSWSDPASPPSTAGDPEVGRIRQARKCPAARQPPRQAAEYAFRAGAVAG